MMIKLNSRDALFGWALAILINVFLLTHPSGLAEAMTNGATDSVFTFEQKDVLAPSLMLAKRLVPSTHNSGMVGGISSGSGGSGDKPVQPRSQPQRQPTSHNDTNFKEVLPDFMRTPQFLNK